MRPCLPWRFHCWSIWWLNLLAKVTVTSSLTKTSTESSTSTSATWKWSRKILRSQASKCEVPAAISTHYNVPLPHGQQPPAKSQLRQNEKFQKTFLCCGSKHDLLISVFYLYIGSTWDILFYSLTISLLADNKNSEAQWERFEMRFWGRKTFKKSGDFLFKNCAMSQGNLRFFFEFDPNYMIRVEYVEMVTACLSGLHSVVCRGAFVPKCFFLSKLLAEVFWGNKISNITRGWK